jgi:hypothetical protein
MVSLIASKVIESTVLPVANGPLISRESTEAQKVGDMNIDDLVTLLLERGRLRDQEDMVYR